MINNNYLNLFHDNLLTSYHLHQQYISEVNKLKFITVMSSSEYWQEFGAWIVSLPRRAGKTTFVKLLYAMDPDNTLILVPTRNQCELYEAPIKAVNVSKFLNNPLMYSSEKTNLVLDEYKMVNDTDLNKILNWSWKSVSLFGR